MSEDQKSEVNQSILFLVNDPNSIRQPVEYLKKRNWEVKVTTKIKEAITLVLTQKPDYFFVSANSSNPKAMLLPKVLKHVNMIVIGEKFSPVVMEKIRNSECKYQLVPPLTGPSMERITHRITRDNEQAEAELEANLKSGTLTKEQEQIIKIKSGKKAADGSSIVPQSDLLNMLMGGADGENESSSGAGSDQAIASGDPNSGNNSSSSFGGPGSLGAAYVPNQGEEGSGSGPGSSNFGGPGFEGSGSQFAKGAAYQGGAYHGEGSGPGENGPAYNPDGAGTPGSGSGYQQGDPSKAGSPGYNPFGGNNSNHGAGGFAGNQGQGQSGNTGSYGSGNDGAGSGYEGGPGSNVKPPQAASSGPDLGETGAKLFEAAAHNHYGNQIGKTPDADEIDKFSKDDFEKGMSDISPRDVGFNAKGGEPETESQRKKRFEKFKNQALNQFGKLKKAAMQRRGKKVSANYAEEEDAKSLAPDQILIQQAAELEKMESILAEGVNKALRESVLITHSQIGESDSPEKKIREASRVACISVKSAKFNGYLLAAFSENRSVDEDLVSLIQKRLTEYIQELGEDMSFGESMQLQINEVAFEAWAHKHSDFLKKAYHQNEEVAIAFFPLEEEFSDTVENETLKKYELSIQELRGDLIVEFDLFLHLPTNNKLLKFTPKGLPFYDTQRQRLDSRGIQKMYIGKEATKDLKKYRLQNYLNDKINEFYDQEKKSS